MLIVKKNDMWHWNLTILTWHRQKERDTSYNNDNLATPA